MVSSTLAFIVPSAVGDAPAREVGSATVVRTPAGKVILLSVSHNFAEPAPVRSVGYSNAPDAINDAIDHVISHPKAVPGAANEVDVALAIPKPDAAAELNKVAISYDQIATATDSDIAPEDACIVGGFPWDMTLRHEDKARRIRTQLFASLTYGCTIANRDAHRRYQIPWTGGTFTTPGLWTVATGETKLTTMPQPHGMSGGGLWRFRKPATNEPIWTPQKAGKLIGVQRGWYRDDRTLVVESVATWGEWLAEVIRDVDST